MIPSSKHIISLHFLVLFSLLTFLFAAFLHNCSAIDDTTVITDTQTLTSAGEIYKLGFFSPPYSSNRYVGIWFNKVVTVQTIVWVANRDNPIDGSSGLLRIASNGNLEILDGRQVSVWATNISSISVNNSVVELMDSGNLVLRQLSDGKILWQSFDHPTDTLLPTMMVGTNRRTGKTEMLTSWKGVSDPSTGNFFSGLELIDNIPQVVIWNGPKRHWRSGPWNGRIFIGVSTMYSVYLDGFNIIKDEDTVYLTYDHINRSSYRRFVLDHNGELQGQRWDEQKNEWSLYYSAEANGECEAYEKCGPFGFCNILASPICSCLKGFVPKFEDEWRKGIWSGGCTRKMELKCERSTNSNITEEEKEDGFLIMEMMKVPDFAYWRTPQNAKDCERYCLSNCSCLAYSYEGGIGCMIWGQSLVDIKKFSKGAGANLYIRVAYSELDQKKKSKIIIITTTLIALCLIIVSACAYLYRKRMATKNGTLGSNNMNEASSNLKLVGNTTDLKVYSFEHLAVATGNFCAANKLGEGGFGSVYKGMLRDGQEIAVKRLSKGSTQGSEEFKNEVLVILKLQHRNLVRLFGCCIEGEERMLIYEYMPKKSLDAILFDSAKRPLLDWEKRFNIIEGISRGMLYLHRDSRLRVIHRDLKASNILLDDEMNPKISDFGIARIFGGDVMQANTKRVVGTYGYMSPEYAMEGRFSEKSDVFSFGVLLLEIVSGNRNSVYYNHELSLSLLGYAWHLWIENKTIHSLIDPTLVVEPRLKTEILKCIQVGLLCVQEFAKDRPSMSSILSMLTSENATIPIPKQPAFIERSVSFESQNDVSITSVEGR
ncbi:hypothetical protein MKW92_045185 [Papaver armeniacum]|nr:hypothetical protein MKW92_045185 [Papaver armeniacum]